MRRRLGLFVLLGVLAQLATAAEASAQGAILQVTPQTAVRGSSVTVTGAGFSASTAAIASGVDIRLNTRDAEPLANTNVSPQGTFTLSVPIPAATPPGDYLMMGTQVTTRNRHTFGAPGRTKLRVTAAAGAGAVPGRSPGDVSPAVLAATILAVLALMGGIVVCVRRLRTLTSRTQPHFLR